MYTRILQRHQRSNTGTQTSRQTTSSIVGFDRRTTRSWNLWERNLVRDIDCTQSYPSLLPLWTTLRIGTSDSPEIVWRVSMCPTRNACVLSLRSTRSVLLSLSLSLCLWFQLVILWVCRDFHVPKGCTLAEHSLWKHFNFWSTLFFFTTLKGYVERHSFYWMKEWSRWVYDNNSTTPSLSDPEIISKVVWNRFHESRD